MRNHYHGLSFAFLCCRPGTHRLPIFLLFIILSGVFVATATSAADFEAEQRLIEEKIASQSISINALQQGLQRQQEQALETIAQERNLLSELESIDLRLGEQQEKLSELEQSLTRQQQLITAKETEIADLQEKKLRAQGHLQKRVVAYYKTGTIGMINALFSADTLPKLLSIHDSFDTLIAYDQRILQQYRLAIDELQKGKDALTLEINLLNTFRDQTAQENETLAQIRVEKNELLAQIRTQTMLHEQAAREIEKAASSLAAQIAAMERRKELLNQGFLMNKGKLPAPVGGKVLALYEQPRKTRMGIEGVATGLAIEVPDDTPVKAIFEGVVHYAGYLRGYGNTIIIDHGYQYFTVISRVETLLKKEGEQVNAGDEIAITGPTATLVEEGVYFEIRQESRTLDPLDWITRDGLTFP